MDSQNNQTVLETLFDDIEPDSVTGYTSLSPGVHSFELTNSDKSTVHDVVEVDLNALAGKAISGVIVPVSTPRGTSATLEISDAAEPPGINKNSGIIMMVYPGIYFYTLKTESGIATRKLTRVW